MGIGNLIFILIGLGFIAFGFSFYRRVREIEDTPTSKIATAPQGHVELEGRALRLNQPAIQNNRGQDVVTKEVIIHEEVRSQDRTEWREISKTRHGNSFYIQDPSGIALIEARDFEIMGSEAKFPYVGRPDTLKPMGDFGNFQISVGGGPMLKFGNTRRVTEVFILEGDPIFLHGKIEALPNSLEVNGHTIKSRVIFHADQKSFIANKNQKKLLFNEKLKFFGLLGIGIYCLYIGFTSKFH